MPIKFKCGKCGQELNVKDEMAGKQGKCPGCKAVVNVPSATAAKSSVTSSPARKKVVDDDDVVEAAEFVDDEDDDDRPKKKSRRDDDDDDDDRPRKKSRRDDDDDDDDDRPRKKRSRDDDDDDDDDRPRKKRSRDDDDDDDDYDRPAMNPKKRKAGFRKAALGVNLATIGNWVTVGGFGVSVILALIFGIAMGGRGGGGGKTLFDIMNILGYLVAFALIAGIILRVIGSAMIITTPGKSGELAFGIACVSTAGLSALMLLLYILEFFNVPMGYGGTMAWSASTVEFNPLAGVGTGGFTVGGIGGRGGVHFAVWILPLLEVAWLVLFSLYIWSVGKSNKDRESRSKGMLMVIITPSVSFGMGLILFLLGKISMTNMIVPALFMCLYLLVIAGMLIWLNLVATGAKWTLSRAK